MDNKVILNPFKEEKNIVDIALILHSAITVEAEAAQEAIRAFNNYGGDNADGENFYRAQFCKAEAEKSHYTLLTLERIAKDFADLLTPEARGQIRLFLDDIELEYSKKKNELLKRLAG